MLQPRPQNISDTSYRDPSGFLFKDGEKLYRQVNLVYREHYEHLFSSGLYQKLTSAGLLIPHREVDIQPPTAEIGYKVIQPELVPFISYPFEWGFGQYRDAALTTLKIQKIALEYGMTLKDASAYNIQFLGANPTLIDTLSFEIYQPAKPWIAYRQFCQHFLAPLALMSYRDIRLGQLMRVYIDGIPLDLASGLLPGRTRFTLPLLFHIHMHANAQKRHAATTPTSSSGVFSLTAMLGLIDNLESGIRALRWKPADTEWGNYYGDTNYTDSALALKEKFVDEFLERIKPHIVWDLGANNGFFSRLASARGIPTMAFDIDPLAVEKGYQDARKRSDKYLLPLLLDLTNPSPAMGWSHRERSSMLERGPAGAVLALALIHHLAISNNVPLHMLADFFAEAGDWLIIEFVPKSDSQVQRLLVTREDIFPSYDVENFEAVFRRRFTIHQAVAIEGSDRQLYLMEKHR